MYKSTYHQHCFTSTSFVDVVFLQQRKITSVDTMRFYAAFAMCFLLLESVFEGDAMTLKMEAMEDSEQLEGRLFPY